MLGAKRIGGRTLDTTTPPLCLRGSADFLSDAFLPTGGGTSGGTFLAEGHCGAGPLAGLLFWRHLEGGAERCRGVQEMENCSLY